MSKYATNKKAHELFYNYVRFILGRTNRYTGLKYTEDPAIMSWQIGNEPRAFDKAVLPDFEQWLAEASALIRSLDANHLISVGSEGSWGCENDYDSYRRICADKNIDYCNIHLWPYNWSWARQDHLIEDLPKAKANTKDYIDRHLEICAKLNKPLVMEEFGYPVMISGLRSVPPPRVVTDSINMCSRLLPTMQNKAVILLVVISGVGVVSQSRGMSNSGRWAMTIQVTRLRSNKG
jgi:endo-1,4-beta-mannosidase